MARRPRRSYFLPNAREHVWSSRVKKLSKEDQIELMRHWFDDRYTWPNELQYDSGEGGYQWVWGGPYDAEDALENEFSGVTSDEAIKELVSELEEISYEWSGRPSDDDFDDDYLAELIDSGTDPLMNLISNLIDVETAATRKRTVRDGAILHRLLFANVVTSLETFLGDALAKVLLEREDLLFHFYRTAPRFRDVDPKVDGVEPTEEHMKSSVKKLLAWNIWHHMKKTAKVYKDALEMEFPADLETINAGIRDRHDIVHRNGKSIDGVMGSWGVADILALKEAVILLASDIQSKIDNLPPAPSPGDFDDQPFEI